MCTCIGMSHRMHRANTSGKSISRELRNRNFTVIISVPFHTITLQTKGFHGLPFLMHLTNVDVNSRFWKVEFKLSPFVRVDSFHGFTTKVVLVTLKTFAGFKALTFQTTDFPKFISIFIIVGFLKQRFLSLFGARITHSLADNSLLLRDIREFHVLIRDTWFIRVFLWRESDVIRAEAVFPFKTRWRLIFVSYFDYSGDCVKGSSWFSWHDDNVTTANVQSCKN